MIRLEQHPLSAAFPSMPDEDLKALAADIAAHGLYSPITLLDGQVLDGWHRYRACLEAKMKPRFGEFSGDDPVSFVRSVNWHRRHLTASQRAAVIVDLKKWKPVGSNQHGGAAPGADPAATNAEMAKEADVSERTVRQAKTVAANGTEKLKQDVKDGKISVKEAAKVAALPKREQAKAIAESKAVFKREPAPEKQPDPADDFAPDLVAELERADKEIRSLQALVDSLQSPDLAKEVVTWRDKFFQLEGRLQQCMTTGAEAQRQAKYQGELLAKIRKVLRVEANGQILPALER